MNIKCIINLTILIVASSQNLGATHVISTYDFCPAYKKGQSLNVQDVVGVWMTVYSHPKAVDCFKFHVRATMELEREQYIMKYGDFDGRVKWNLCLLQVDTKLGKHFLMGNGSEAGLMKNIIIMTKEHGKYTLLDQTADQWAVFGRRGSELLIIRHCYGNTAAAFARAPYWPTTTELSAILHRSGITVQTYSRLLCEPECHPTIQQETGGPYHIKRN